MRTKFLLFFGLILLLLLHALHFADVLHLATGTAFAPYSLIVRANMTPLAWCAYLLILLGLLSWLDGTSYLRRFRNRFAVCWLWSVAAWCYFDVMNFYFMTDGPNLFQRWYIRNHYWMNFYFMRDHATGLRAWEYVNLPLEFSDRLGGYLIAFGAIAPGMFLTGDVLQRLGFRKLNYRRKHETRNTKHETQSTKHETWITAAVLALGIALAPIPIFVGTPASNLAIWVGTWALLDPINRYFDRPSILTDWFAGRWGRTLALGWGGLFCGFLWEFWNYWAFTKWTYHLPFLGRFENYRYFEMPLPGLLGFIAFGLETWAMWQTSLLILSPFVEGESRAPPSLADQAHRDYACL